MKPLPHLHLDHQLCFRLYSVSRLVTQAYQPFLKALDLTYPQYLVLLVLWEEAEAQRLPVSVKFLCGRLRLDTGTLTPLLKRMEQAGLVQRNRSADDERVVLIQLTDAGLALREQASGVPGQVLCRTGLSVEEVAGLREQLGRLLSVWDSKSD